MLWKILTTLGVPSLKSKCSKAVHGCYDPASELVRNLNSFSRQEAESKRGGNLAPSSLSLSSHAVSNTLDKEMDFPQLTLDGFRTLQVGSKPARNNYAEPITPTRAQCSRSSVPSMSTIRPSFFSAANDRRLKLSSLTFDVLV
jgi:hypothetical protein